MDNSTLNAIGTGLALVIVLAYLEYRTLIEYAKTRALDNALCASAIRTGAQLYASHINAGKSKRFARSDIRAHMHIYGFSRVMLSACVSQAIKDARFYIIEENALA